MSPPLPAALLDDAARQLAAPGLRALLGELLGAAPDAIDTGMHPACQMLGHSLAAHGDAGLAVSQYFAVALQQDACVRQLQARLFPDAHGAPRRDLDLLDFACGYGRLLRLLVHRHPPERTWAAEIQPEAVAHVAARYGVHGLASPPVPEDFAPGRRFDLLWVASLFSHLPDGLFQRWLRVLAGSLAPGGALCFSVHDEALLPADIPLPASGLHYIAGSENAALDAAIYGTTFVSEDYVRRAVAEACGPGWALARLPRLLAHEQDVYVLAAPGADGVPARELAALDGLERGLRGWLDGRAIGDDGRLHLRGWAGSVDPPRGPDDACRVELRVGEGATARVMLAPIDADMPEVARVLGLPHLARSGWSAAIDVPAPGERLSVLVRDGRGRAALVYTALQ